MAILHRFGSADDFDPNKMRARELAYVNTSNSTYKAGLYLCYAPGDVRRQTTEQDIINILNTTPTAYAALQQLITDLESNPSELTNILSNISNLQSGKLDKTGDSKDNTATFTEAITEADIATGESHATILGKILKSIKTFRNTINELVNGKIDKTSIVNTDTVNDTTKVPSSAVTYAHSAQISSLTNSVSELNNNLIKVAVISQSQDIPANTDTVFEFTLSAYSNIIETIGQVTGTGVNSDISIIRLYATANKFVVRSGTAQTVFVNCMVIYK